MSDKPSFLARYGNAKQIHQVLDDSDRSDVVQASVFQNPHIDRTHIDKVVHHKPAMFGSYTIRSALEHPLTTEADARHVVRTHVKEPWGSFNLQCYMKARHRLQDMGLEPDEA